jgi:deazaflavin-dependent oxidoreductase (nitroreductase family)
MPLPRTLGQFNVRVTNRILGPIVTRLPWFAWLEHVGRRTGRHYRTPIMVFRRGDRAVIAMTYGPDTDWARNVVAAGGAVVVGRDRRPVRITDPRVEHDPDRRLVPWFIRPALSVLDAADFFVSTVTAEDDAPAAGSDRPR